MVHLTSCMQFGQRLCHRQAPEDGPPHILFAIWSRALRRQVEEGDDAKHGDNLSRKAMSRAMLLAMVALMSVAVASVLRDMTATTRLAMMTTCTATQSTTTATTSAWAPPQLSVSETPMPSFPSPPRRCSCPAGVSFSGSEPALRVTEKHATSLAVPRASWEASDNPYGEAPAPRNAVHSHNDAGLNNMPVAHSTSSTQKKKRLKAAMSAEMRGCHAIWHGEAPMESERLDREISNSWEVRHQRRRRKPRRSPRRDSPPSPASR